MYIYDLKKINMALIFSPFIYHTTGYTGPEELGDCLKNCEVVVIPAGIPRKPGKFLHGNLLQ